MKDALPSPRGPDPLDDIDFSEPIEMYGQKYDHDLLLLALSADKYPVALEQMARKLKKALLTSP